MNVPVIFAGDRLTVVDKPAGVRSEDVAASLGKKLGHRLDQGTSGLLVMADDARTVQRLHRLLAAGAVSRRYRFVAHGVVVAATISSRLVRNRGDGLRGTRRHGEGSPDDNNISNNISNDISNERHEGHNDDDGKLSTTIVTPVWTASDGRISGGAATLVTGRTHQVRIHLAEAGHPLVGEPVYVRDYRAQNLPLQPSTRLMLHAWQLTLTHPNTRAALALVAPLPPGFDDPGP